MDSMKTPPARPLVGNPPGATPQWPSRFSITPHSFVYQYRTLASTSSESQNRLDLVSNRLMINAAATCGAALRGRQGQHGVPGFGGAHRLSGQKAISTTTHPDFVFVE
jgi:hypothetical protein